MPARPLPLAAQKEVIDAVAMLTESMAQGHPQAPVQLALLYKRGVGVEQDDTRHFQLLTHAAHSKGCCALAQANLGYAYRDGVGCEQSHKLAFEWWEKAVSRARMPSVQSDIGMAYQEGLGVQQNIMRAAALFKLAADQGDGGAMNNLARCYREGRGVWQSFAKARRHYQLAEEKIPAVAENIQYLEADIQNECPLLGTRVVLHDLITRDSLNGSYGVAIDFQYEVGPGQLWIQGQTGSTGRYVVRLDGSQRLIKVKAKNAGPGLAVDQLQVAISYRDGLVIDKSPEMAAKWFAMAAGQGDEHALYALALAYSEGSGVEQSDARAVGLLERSAAKGHAAATALLATIRARG